MSAIDAAQREFEQDEREQALEDLIPELRPEIEKFRQKILKLSEDWIDEYLTKEHIIEAVCDELESEVTS